jgi:uncharacterized protein (DUF58 family)
VTSLALLLLKVLAIGAPLGLAWFAFRITPRRPMLWLALAPTLSTFLLIGGQVLLPAVIAIDVLVFVLAAIDFFTLPPQKSLSARRDTLRIASLQKSHKVTLTINNASRGALNLTIRDGVPHELKPLPAEFDIVLAGRSRAVLEYVLNPQRRGSFTAEQTHVAVRSRFGLWQKIIDCHCASLWNVYPDLKQLRQFDLLARTNRLSLMGVRRVRRIGQDHDFERLRDYSLDDNYKRIDWRSTARRSKLTVRDFQSSQSQQLIFLVDGGRMMTNEAKGLSLLDHALNAILMLSFVALRQGDQVGLIHFSDEIHSFIPPRGGQRHMNRLLHASFDRFPRLVESRYDQAFRYLAAHCRKRSLVVLVTNIIDEVNASQVEQYLTNLVGRHLPLGVILRDHRLFDAAAQEVPAKEHVAMDKTTADKPASAPLTGDRLWRAAAAAEILAWRHQAITDLINQGVLALDVFPEQMTAPLINRYLSIKARHLL